MAIEAGQLNLGPGNGRLTLHTGRKGVGATVGHDLTIEVTDWSARVEVPDSGVEAASVTARVELGSLVVRDGTGGAKPLTDKDRREIARNAGQTLGADRYPTATFASNRVVMDPGDGERGTIEGTLTLHGTSAPAEIRVREAAPGRYAATMVVTQTTYGIKPYSAFLGALKVRDEVDVRMEVELPT